MPELPEVETVRRRLEPVLVRRRLERVEIRDTRLTRPLDPPEVAAELEGERVAFVDRRGKYLIVRFETGRALLIHLRMTGNVLHGRDAIVDGGVHTRAVVRLDDGSDVVYRDVRRFGTWLVLEPEELEPYLAARLGEEPLAEAFTPAALARRLEGRRAPVKAALLDQRTVAGVGNIYADEALWRARLHGDRLGTRLTARQVHDVLAGVRAVMEAALLQGGTSFDALYVNVNGQSGYFDRSLQVYGQEDRPCSRCGAAVVRVPFMNRSSYFCPRCQPRPRRTSASARSGALDRD